MFSKFTASSVTVQILYNLYRVTDHHTHSYVFTIPKALYIWNKTTSLMVLKHELMEKLQNIILQCHPYACIFKNAAEILEQQGRHDEVSIRLHFNPCTNDHCHYNLPSADEVPVILPSSGEQESDP